MNDDLLKALSKAVIFKSVVNWRQKALITENKRIRKNGIFEIEMSVENINKNMFLLEQF